MTTAAAEQEEAEVVLGGGGSSRGNRNREKMTTYQLSTSGDHQAAHQLAASPTTPQLHHTYTRHTYTAYTHAAPLAVQLQPQTQAPPCLTPTLLRPRLSTTHKHKHTNTATLRRLTLCRM